MESHAVESKMTQAHLVWLHYVCWYWFFCHLDDFLLNNLPVLKSSSTLETAEPERPWWSAVWELRVPEAVVCNSVNAVADAFSYGFPLGKSFASSFCSKFTGEREGHSVHREYSPPSRATHSSADFFFFFYTLHYLLFIDGVFLSPFQSSFVYNVSM